MILQCALFDNLIRKDQEMIERSDLEWMGSIIHDFEWYFKNDSSPHISGSGSLIRIELMFVLFKHVILMWIKYLETWLRSDNMSCYYTIILSEVMQQVMVYPTHLDRYSVGVMQMWRHRAPWHGGPLTKAALVLALVPFAESQSNLNHFL